MISETARALFDAGLRITVRRPVGGDVDSKIEATIRHLVEVGAVEEVGKRVSRAEVSTLYSATMLGRALVGLHDLAVASDKLAAVAFRKMPGGHGAEIEDVSRLVSELRRAGLVDRTIRRPAP